MDDGIYGLIIYYSLYFYVYLKVSTIEKKVLKKEEEL